MREGAESIFCGLDWRKASSSFFGKGKMAPGHQGQSWAGLARAEPPPTGKVETEPPSPCKGKWLSGSVGSTVRTPGGGGTFLPLALMVTDSRPSREVGPGEQEVGSC